MTTSSRPVKRLCGVRIVVYRFFVLMSTFLFRRIDEGEGQRSEEGEVSAASHRDLFSDLLLNVLHTADTSRPDLVGAQETNILGTKAKSASQAMRKGILKSSGDGDADDVFFDALFGSLLPSGTTVSLVVSDWRARYGAEPAAALAELYTLIARVRSSCEVDTPRQGFFPLILFVKRAAKHTVSLTHILATLPLSQAGGCMITITAEELDSSSAEEIGARVLQEMTAGNLYSDDPMGDTSTSKGLKARFKSFKTNFP